MALEWLKPINQSGRTFRATRRLYLNHDKTEVVPENSKHAAWLLVAEGGTLWEHEARKYGLLNEVPEETEQETEVAEEEKKPEQSQDSKPEDVQTKHIVGPAKTKAISKPEATK